jgi:ubiquitin-activating enzyme E1
VSALPQSHSPETVLKTLLAPSLAFFQSWQPEEFEKDDLSLGHVAFVTSAANLRCILYGLRGVDQLEVQKVAGKIVPALATTTALVSGLVSLELLKIASERLLPVGTRDGGRERVLSRFRNSFVNLARPLLAFAQPVEAEAFGEMSKFTMWDVLEMPHTSVNDLTVSAMSAHLSNEFGVQLQSVSLGDTLLYASFLPGAEERLDYPLRALVVADGEKDTSVAVGEEESAFWDLELVCVSEETGEDVRLPLMRVGVSTSTSKVEGQEEVGQEVEQEMKGGKMQEEQDKAKGGIFALAGRVVSKAKAKAKDLSAKWRRSSKKGGVADAQDS